MAPILLTVRQVADQIGFTRQTIHKWVRAGQFPPPLYISTRSPRWRPADIEAWIESQPRADERAA